MDPVVVFAEMAVGFVLLLALPVTIYALVSARWARKVVCPATNELVQVRLAPGQMAGAMTIGTRHLVRGCSRWPAAAGCNHACEASLPGAA